MPDVFRRLAKKPAASKSSDSIANLKKQRLSFFSHYVELPDGISYENQEDDEKVLVFVRRHPITNIPWLVFTVLFIFIPVPLVPFFSTFLSSLELSEFVIPETYLFVAILFYYLVVLGYALLNFISWFYNISIVSDNEVVDIDYSSVTHKDIASTNLREIQDVEYSQSGFLASFFNYGDVRIQTAGAHPNIEFLRIPNPAKVNDIILDEKRRVIGHE